MAGFHSWIGLIGYLLSAAAYMLRIPEARGNEMIIFGMIILSIGYLALAAAKVIYFIVDAGKEHYADKKHDGDAKAWVLSTKENKNLIAMIGNALLFAFFTASHFIPSLTFHVRFYDIFGAIGYGLYVLAKWVHTIPMYIVALPLVMYYFFGTAIKFTEEGWVDKIQLVGRMLLMVYYAMLPFAAAH